MDWWGTTKAQADNKWMKQIDKRLEGAKPRKGLLSTVLHGTLGAAFGAGLARGAGSVLGMSDGMKDKMETMGMGIGAIWNTGNLDKIAEDELEIAAIFDEMNTKLAAQREQAFRIGFLKAAADQGLFQKLEKKATIVAPIAVSPAELLEIPRGMAKSIHRGGEIAGAGLAALEAPDETEADITQLRVERQILKERLRQAKKDRDNRIVNKVLAERRANR